VGEGLWAAVASDAGGNALIASSDRSSVIVRTRSATGALGAPQTIASAPAGAPAQDIDVAMDADGHAVVAWLQFSNSGGDHLLASTRLPDGSFGPAQLIATDVHGRNKFSLEMAAGGWSALVWDHGYDTERVQASVKPPGGAFGPIEVVSPDGGTIDVPRIAIGPDGSAVAVWDHYTEGTEFASRTPAGTWSAVQELAPPRFGSTWPNVAIDGSGRALAVHMTLNPSASSPLIAGNYRPAGGAFGPDEQVSKPPERSAVTGAFFEPAPVEFDAAGTATVLWRDNESKQLFASTRAAGAGSTFGDPAPVSSDAVDRARLVLSADGSAVAAWTVPRGTGGGPSGPGPFIAAVRSAGGAFGAQQTLAAAAEQFDIATDATGHGVAVWTVRYGFEFCGQVRLSAYSDVGVTGPEPAPPACAAAPGEPPDTTTPPPDPASADSSGPKLVLGGAKRQHPLKRRRVTITVRCDEDCGATGKATVKLGGRGRVKLKPATKQLTAGRRTTFVLRLKASDVRKLRTALASRRRMLRVAVSARDAAGNASNGGRTVALVR
jgi:hypothetical protein